MHKSIQKSKELTMEFWNKGYLYGGKKAKWLFRDFKNTNNLVLKLSGV